MLKKHHRVYTQHRGKTIKGGPKSLTWLNGKNGKKQVCSIDDIGHKESSDQFIDFQKNTFIGSNEMEPQ